jgi:hypothetical protein
MGRARSTHRRNYKCMLSIDTKTQGRDRLKDKDIYGKIMVELIFNTQVMRVRTGFIWLRIGVTVWLI